MGGADALFSTVQFGSFLNYGYYIIYLILGAVVFGAIAYFVLVMLKYKHKVRILEVVGDSIQEFQDKAAMLKDKNTKKAFQLKLLKGKTVLPPPSADAYIFDKRGHKVLYVAKISPTDYIYCKPSMDLTKKEATLIPLEQDSLFWYVNQMEHDNDKYAEKMVWWQNPYVLGLGTMAICLIILIITFRYAGTWQATAKESALALMEAGNGYIGQVVSAPPPG